MSTFEKRQVRLPAELWAKLDAEVEEAMGTITYHWLIAQALEARYGSARAALPATSNSDTRDTVRI